MARQLRITGVSSRALKKIEIREKGIKNDPLLNELNKRFICDEGPLSYEQVLRIFEAMRQETKSLSIFPLDDPMKRIDVDIRIARTLNSYSKPSSRT